MPTIDLPTDGEEPWGLKLNTAINTINDQVDANSSAITTLTSDIDSIENTVFAHRQLDATNDSRRFLIQQGIGKITGGASPTASEAVTFPVAYAAGTVPVVIVNTIGLRATGAFNAVSIPSTAQSVIGSAQQPSATGFNAFLYQATGSNLGATNDFYYSWTAIGVPA